MKLQNLQFLRGIAALLVCCFHMRDWLNVDGFATGDWLFGSGSIGVPIFFVISGFIIAHTTRNFGGSSQGKQALEFLKKRILRIVPLYYLLTFSWMIIGGSFALYWQGEGFARLWHSLLFIPYATEPVLFLGWSLNFEIFFYFIFTLSIFLGRLKYYFLLIFFGCTVATGQLWNFHDPVAKMVFSFLNLNFLLGIIFYQLINKFTKFSVIKSLIPVGIILFCAMYFKLIQIDNNLLFCLVVSLFVFSFLLLDYSTTLRPHKFFSFLGDISFSIYLVHPFIQILFKKFHSDNFLLNAVLFSVQLICIITSAYFTYELIEKRATGYLKNKFAT